MIENAKKLLMFVFKVLVFVFKNFPFIRKIILFIRKSYFSRFILGFLLCFAFFMLQPVVIFDKSEGANQLSRYKHYLDNDIYNCATQYVYFTGEIRKVGNTYSFAVFGSDRFMLPHETNTKTHQRIFTFNKPHYKACNKFVKAMYEHDQAKIEEFGCEFRSHMIICSKDKLINKDCPEIAHTIFNNYKSTQGMNYCAFIIKNSNDILAPFYSKSIDIVINHESIKDMSCKNVNLINKILNSIEESHGDPLYSAKVISIQEFGFTQTIEYNLHVFFNKVKHLII